MLKRVLISLIVLSLTSQVALADFGPRALGMGGAYTAIADDAYAAYWNPAGFAINPGIDLAGHYQMNNRNLAVGDNMLGLKACFELEMNPFAWALGVGVASMFALEGAHYLADRGIVKKGWGRGGKAVSKKEAVANDVKADHDKRRAAGEKVERKPISRKAVAKKAAKEVAKGTIAVSKKLAKAAVREAARQTRHYYYAPGWYRPNYYRPNYWDNRYDYEEKDLTPAGKAQFAAGFSLMTDKNASLKQNTNWYTFSLASGWGEIVALGANFNIYDLELTNFTPTMRGLGAGFDVGGLVRFSEKLMFGLTVKELLTTDIRLDDGSTFRYQMSVNGGVALKPYQQITIAADVHNIFEQNNKAMTMHYGVEVRPIYGVALRAGLSDDNKTAGASFGVGDFIIDYAILGGAYNRTQTIGATWKI